MSAYNPEFTGNPKHTVAADAMHRALTCADAVNSLLTTAVLEREDENIGVNMEVVAGVLWTIDGLINQAQSAANVALSELKDAQS